MVNRVCGTIVVPAQVPNACHCPENVRMSCASVGLSVRLCPLWDFIRRPP